MATQGEKDYLSTDEEDTVFSSNQCPDNRLRGRIMATGYRYNLLEEPSSNHRENRVKFYQRRYIFLAAAQCVTTAVFVGLAVVFFLVIRSGDEAKDAYQYNTCLTPGCIETSASILSKMDTSVNPCEDIYRYACGGWMKATSIPSGLSKENMFSQAARKNNQFLRKALEDKSNEFRGYNSTAISKFKMAYRSCMDTDSINRVGTSKLVELIKRVGSWSVVNLHTWDSNTWDLQTSLEVSHGQASLAFFSAGLIVDDKNTNRYILKFTQSGLSLSYANEYLQYNSNVFKKGFLDFATEVATLLGGDEKIARTKLEQVYELEKNLAAIFVLPDNMTSPTDTYHKMTLKEFQDLVGNTINFQRYLKATMNGIEVPETEEIIVATPDYFKKLASVFSSVDKEVLANYMTWSTVRHFIGFLPEAFSKASFHLTRVQTGVVELPPRWELCVGYAKSVAGFVASAIYVDAKFSPEDRSLVERTVANIQKDFIDNMDTVAWLDDVTKSRLLEKANAIHFMIGYPDWILDHVQLDKYYEKLDIQEGELFLNGQAAIKFGIEKQLEKYGTVPDRTEWTEFPVTVNGYYEPTFNSVIMPAAILQEPFFSRHFPKPFLYSTIGMVVGHEFTHAFDNTGRMYDKNGNLGNQWTSSAARMYNTHAQCIVKQYNGFSLQGAHLNGKTTLNENIADNGALRLGYQALNKDKTPQSYQNLPGLNLTQDQMFFLGYAQVMCALYTPQYQIEAIQTDVHSFPEFRVKGVYANMPQFWKAFNCPQADDSKFMDKVCRVW